MGGAPGAHLCMHTQTYYNNNNYIFYSTTVHKSCVVYLQNILMPTSRFVQ